MNTTNGHFPLVHSPRPINSDGQWLLSLLALNKGNQRISKIAEI
jgi:hypothetical protein